MGAAQVRFVPTLAGQNHQRGGSQSLERMVRISSMNGPQSLELSVSITGIHSEQAPLRGNAENEALDRRVRGEI